MKNYTFEPGGRWSEEGLKELFLDLLVSAGTAGYRSVDSSPC